MLATYRPELHRPLALRWIMSGAGPVPPSLIEAYGGLGLEVHQVYGLTESAGHACVISPDVAMSHDSHAHGIEGVQFYTSGKAITSRWLDPSHGGINLGFPENK